MNWLKVECSQKKIFVMPAFETATNPSMTAAHQIANEAAKQDKKGLLRMVEAGKVWQFALKIFKEVRSSAQHCIVCSSCPGSIRLGMADGVCAKGVAALFHRSYCVPCEPVLFWFHVSAC